MPSSSQIQVSCPEQTWFLASNQSRQEGGRHMSPPPPHLRFSAPPRTSPQAVAPKVPGREEVWHPCPGKQVVIFWHPATPSESPGRPGRRRLPRPRAPRGAGPRGCRRRQLPQGPGCFQLTGKTYLSGFPFPPLSD